MDVTLPLTRRAAAALRAMKTYGLFSEMDIVRVALRRLIRTWNATPEYAPGVTTREELAG